MSMSIMRVSPKECPFCHDMPVLAKVLYRMKVMVIMEIMNIMAIED